MSTSHEEKIKELEAQLEAARKAAAQKPDESESEPEQTQAKPTQPKVAKQVEPMVATPVQAPKQSPAAGAEVQAAKPTQSEVGHRSGKQASASSGSPKAVQLAAGSKLGPKSGMKAPKSGTQAAHESQETPQQELVEEVQQRPRWGGILRRCSAFTVSTIVHALIVLVLGLYSLPAETREQIFSVTSIPPPEHEEMPEELEVNIDPSVDAQTEASSDVVAALDAMAVLPNLPTVPEIQDQPTEDNLDFDTINPFQQEGETLQKQIEYGKAKGNPSAVVDDYDEALDRITQEILTLMSDSKVLVVWLFDQSESMQDDRQEIKSRVRKVYAELGIPPNTRGKPLLTAICSYGENFLVHTRQPSDDFGIIERAIDAVPNDPSGKEIMCEAVARATNHYKRYGTTGQRKIALILVTDESGEHENNRNFLETAIAEAQAAQTRVYVLGREAVFGYPYAHMRWTDPNTDIVYWRRINRGPESPDVEQLQTNGFYRRHDAHASGFGPYEQTRMVRETGGVFFLLPSPETNLVRRDDRKYQLEAMRPYLPDLGPRDEYLAEVAKHPLRLGLRNLIYTLNPYDKQAAKYVNMRHHFSINRFEFQKQAQQEIAKAKNYIDFLGKALEDMKALEGHRKKEHSFRWQANYDLIYAQLVAYRVRLWEYIAYLDQFAKKPKEISRKSGPRRTTHWELRIRKPTLTVGEENYLKTTLKIDIDNTDEIARAREMLQHVIDEHPGTPWSTRAEWELRRGFGIHLVEDFIDPRRGKNVKLPKL